MQRLEIGKAITQTTRSN